MRRNFLLFIALYCSRYNALRQFSNPVLALTVSMMAAHLPDEAGFGSLCPSCEDVNCSICQESDNIYENCKKVFIDGSENLSIFTNRLYEISSQEELKDCLNSQTYNLKYDNHYIFTLKYDDPKIENKVGITQTFAYDKSIEEPFKKYFADKVEIDFKLNFAITKNKILVYLNNDDNDSDIKAILYSIDRNELIEANDNTIQEIQDKDNILVVSYSIDDVRFCKKAPT